MCDVHVLYMYVGYLYRRGLRVVVLREKAMREPQEWERHQRTPTLFLYLFISCCPLYRRTQFPMFFTRIAGVPMQTKLKFYVKLKKERGTPIAS